MTTQELMVPVGGAKKDREGNKATELCVGDLFSKENHLFLNRGHN